MASEYLRWKYRDVPHDAPPPVLTAKERRANWWHYHKWHVVIGAVVLLALTDIGLHILGVGRQEPDYQFAYVGARMLPADAVSAFEEALAALGTDWNGDGRVLVRLNQYPIAAADTAASGNTDTVISNGADTAASGDTVIPVSDNADAAMYAYAASVRLMGDLQSGDSAFFLLKDPEQFQRDYEILSGDGVFLWAECPVLAALPLGEYTENLLGEERRGDTQSLFSGLYLARRDFQTEKQSAKQSAYAEQCDILWNTLTDSVQQNVLTEGAAS